MLRDWARVNAYTQALREVLSKTDNVLDAGSGLGILAKISRSITSGRVTAVEYFEPVSALAKIIAERCRLGDIDFVASRTYDVTVFPPPDIVVTETIGLIGPEENIVEICFDLKRRHPSIRAFVPSSMSLMIQAIQSNEVDRLYSETLEDLSGPGLWDIEPAHSDIEQAYCNQIHNADLLDAIVKSPPQIIADYDLGVTGSPDFHLDAEFDLGHWNAVCLYFDASLSPNVSLRNDVLSEKTHWMHNYIRRPGNSSKLSIKYDGASQAFEIQWM